MIEVFAKIIYSLKFFNYFRQKTIFVAPDSVLLFFVFCFLFIRDNNIVFYLAIPKGRAQTFKYAFRGGGFYEKMLAVRFVFLIF